MHGLCFSVVILTLSLAITLAHAAEELNQNNHCEKGFISNLQAPQSERSIKELAHSQNNALIQLNRRARRNVIPALLQYHREVKKLNTTHYGLAEPLHLAINAIKSQQTTFQYANQTFEVIAEKSSESQISIFNHELTADLIVQVRNPRTSQSIRFSAVVAYEVERFGYYQLWLTPIDIYNFFNSNHK